MAKKIIIVAALVAIAIALVIYIPRKIEEKRRAEAERMEQMERRATEKAEETIGDKLGITGGNAGFGGKYSEKARDNSTKAHNRSAEYLEEVQQEDQ